MDLRQACKHGIVIITCVTCVAAGTAPAWHAEQERRGWYGIETLVAREPDHGPEHERGPAHVRLHRAEVRSTGAVGLDWVAAESPTGTVMLPPSPLLAGGRSMST